MLSTHSIAAGHIPVASPNLNLPPFIVKNLQEKGITSLFPAQAEVVPFLMREGYNHDVCVMSPTGTGKTLAYAIPIVKRLHRRVIPRIRALIVLPSHDLTRQVSDVFSFLVQNTDLKVCAIGGVSLQEEHFIINESPADIVIAAPGRLQSHIDSNPYFTLQHLEFLVIDEADKLLSNFAPWLTELYPHIYNTKQGFLNVPMTGQVTPKEVNIATMRVSHLNPKGFENSPPLRRWLFSATLTSQSTLIAQMHLQSPMFFTALSANDQLKYQYPKNLMQYYVSVPGDMRGVALVKIITSILLKSKNSTSDPFASSSYSSPTAKIACFAQDSDACHRLYTILKLMLPQLSVSEFFSSLGDAERAKVLDEFERGLTNIVVCSDLMARGLDISNIHAVINYDVPEHIKKYIHRVGRTARGFNAGVAYSIIEPDEREGFLEMVQKGNNLNLEELVYNEHEYGDELISKFQAVLPKMHAILLHEELQFVGKGTHNNNLVTK
eukprot:Phypoly_transcript_06022.p1 GENE.Phypoly_transcript_06022~~Phypoly_transcript_06022.p1  ORF type:complete len:494 (+),score=46.99 Phypoly_transcript_06022:178-1659(+)